MVREIAVQAGDVTSALKAVEILETRFDLPPLELRLASLEELSGGLKDSGQSARLLAAEAEKVLIAACDADDYPHAVRAHKIQLASLRKTGDRVKVAKAASVKSALLEAEQAYRLVPAALSALATNPENAEANGVAGTYYCLVKNNWDLGLPMLARGEDLKLRILARMDLDPDKGGPQRLQVADQYWDLASSYKLPQRRSLELRAAFHYAAARPLLTSGIDLVQAEKRIEEVGRRYGKEAQADVATSTSDLRGPMPNPQDDSG